MEDYINSNNNDFKKFKISYTDKELKCIKAFNISKPDEYYYMGNKNNMKNLNQFLNNVGTNDKECIKILEKAIMKILDNVLVAFDKDYYWINIRVTLPNNVYNIPRWHRDGQYFDSEIKSPKFITTLKGPGTLLIKSTKKVSDIYQKMNNDLLKLLPISESDKKFNKYRLFLAKAFKNTKIIQSKNNEGVIIYPQIFADINEGANIVNQK